jgi:Mor family transcriptional regulator
MPCTLECLAEILREKLAQHGLDELTEEIVSRFADRVGGERVYIARRPRSEWAERNAQLRREFNGRNHAELARKYRLSRSRIYDILKD